MFGILAEDDSDVATLKTLVKRITGKKPRMRGKGYDGCGKLLKDGARDIAMFRDMGLSHFIVCYDADRLDPSQVKALVWSRVASPAGLGKECCIVVPVQEIEAWILADLDAITHFITSFRPPKPIACPENIQDPKEHLEGLTKNDKGVCLYEHSRHNEKAAIHLHLPTVRAKCPSYRPFEEFVLAPPAPRQRT